MTLRQTESRTGSSVSVAASRDPAPRRGRAFRAALGLALLAALALPASAQRQAVKNPHGEFRGDCSLCHGPEAWAPAEFSPDFDHGNFGWSLQGAHSQVDCLSCHASLDFTRTPTDCVDCHQDVHRGQMGTDCERCHDTRSFIARGEMLRTHQMTRFPLTGAHRVVDCEQCHKPVGGALVFVSLPIDCVSCHLEVFRATTNPDHETSGFSTECEQCHTTATWRQVKFGGQGFNHDLTAFPLTGAHRAAVCQDCHGDGVYAGKSADCVSCHLADYNATANPNHTQAGYSTNCAACHSTTAWIGAGGPGGGFDHSQSAFPLTGAHRAAGCQDCHGDGVYAGKSTDCVSCHLADYNGTANPNHASAGFSTQCQDCHSTTAWLGAGFDHAQTQFPLTGAHRAAPCQSCHGDGVYGGKPTDCASCHLNDYNQTTNPNHQSARFPTTCEDCHNTSAWPGATYDHNQTNFPLTGSHLAATCQDCHGDGVYAGKSTQCVSCHLTDYNQTTNPDHRAAGFPTNCESCHDTSIWQNATFDHDGLYFPIYTGKHKGKWNDCADCHTNRNNYADFTCFNCHEHSKTKMDDKHKNISGYSYDPNACYSCHPRGRA